MRVSHARWATCVRINKREPGGNGSVASCILGDIVLVPINSSSIFEDADTRLHMRRGNQFCQFLRSIAHLAIMKL
jgi:hypothetical protein